MDGYATVRLPSGEQRRVLAACRATVGALSNPQHKNRKLGKAGAARWSGRRPTVRIHSSLIFTLSFLLAFRDPFCVVRIRLQAGDPITGRDSCSIMLRVTVGEVLISDFCPGLKPG